MNILDYFPMEHPRPSQVEALQFVEDAVAEGYKDIVLEVPTGGGKSAIGAALCYWGVDYRLTLPPDSVLLSQPGGYYLVTQKQLQEQIQKDVYSVYKRRNFQSLYSASGYACESHISCQIGMRRRCRCLAEKRCCYQSDKARFTMSEMSLTNYPYFITERTHVGKFQVRNVLVMDEVHTLESQLLKIGDVELSDFMLKDCGLRMTVPEVETKQEFADWLGTQYLPKLKARLAELNDTSDISGGLDSADPDEEADLARSINTMENQVHAIETCITGILTRPDSWVYWQEHDEELGNVAYCKPTDAAPYMATLRNSGVIRVYMSAYPGEKNAFCASLGLNPATVAWLKVGSSFDKSRRPTLIGNVGSMSKANLDQSFEPVMRSSTVIIDNFKNMKGLIHCHSYALGKRAYDFLKKKYPGRSILFHTNAEERQTVFDLHCSPESKDSIIISPSMTEGFDFKDDLARWQIILKIPYPYLGDRVVAKKKELSNDWYAMQAVMKIIQASGRVCRSDEDWGVTYILDADFESLYSRYRKMFPAWFTESIKYLG